MQRLWPPETDADAHLEYAANNSNSVSAKHPFMNEDARGTWQSDANSLLVRGVHPQEDLLSDKDRHLFEAPIEDSAMRRSLFAMTPHIDLDLHYLSESQMNRQKHIEKRDHDKSLVGIASIGAKRQNGISGISRLSQSGLARVLLLTRPKSRTFPETIGGVHHGSGVTALPLSGARMSLPRQMLRPETQVIQLLWQREILRLREEIVLMRQELESRRVKKLEMRANLYSAADHSLALSRMDRYGGSFHHNALDVKSHAKGGFASMPGFSQTDPVDQSLVDIPKKKQTRTPVKKDTSFKIEGSATQLSVPAKAKTLALPSDPEVFSGYQCLIDSPLRFSRCKRPMSVTWKTPKVETQKLSLAKSDFVAVTVPIDHFNGKDGGPCTFLETCQRSTRPHRT